MPRSKRAFSLIVGALVAVILALVGPALYAQGRMVTTTGVVFVRGIIGSIPITVANIVTTSTDGLLVQNTTAAVVGVPVQYSPRLRLCGTAWKTDATTASQIDCDLIELRPVSAAGATTSKLVFGSSINGGAYADVMTLTSAGNVGIGTTTPGTLLTVDNTVNGGIGLVTRAANANSDIVARFFQDTAAPSNDLVQIKSQAAAGTAFNLLALYTGATTSTGTGGTSQFVVRGDGTVSVGANMTLRGTVPTVTGGGSTCGTSAPVIVGTDSAGKVTTGSIAPSVCVVTFSSAWTNAPACGAANETTGNLLRPTSTTTTLTLTGTMVAGDVLAYHCIGY